MGYSERMALRVVSAALCAQLASGTFCNHEVQTASQSDDHAEGEPHRVLVLIIPLFIIFYSIVMGLFYLVYGCLRKGPATEFAVLVEQGRVVEDDLDKDEAKIEPLNTDGWWSKSLQDIHKEDGLDAVLYLEHVKQMSQFCLYQFLTMGLGLLCLYQFAGDYEGSGHEEKWYVWGWTYANLVGPADPDRDPTMKRFIPVICSWWCCGAICLFALKKQASMDTYKLDEEEGGGSTSRFTIWVQGVSIKATQEAMDTYFSSNYEGDVVKSALVYNVNKLGHNVRTQRANIMGANKLTKSLSDAGTDAAKVNASVAALKAKNQVLAAEETQLRAGSRELRCVGSAFVTFSSTSKAQKFRQAIAEDSIKADAALGTSGWSSKMAPRPAEMYWENFGVDASEASVNKFKSMAYTFLIFFLFVVISLGAVWVIGFEYMYYLYYMPAEDWVTDSLCDQMDSVGKFIWYGVFGMFFVIAFLVLEEEMAPIVKFIAKYEAPLTKSMKQSAYLGKCYWFYVIYHMLLSTTVLGWLASNVKVDEDFFLGSTKQGTVKLYVEAIGAFHQHRVFLTVGIIDMIHVLEGVKFFPRSTHQLKDEEQDQFNSAEDEDEDDKSNENGKDKFFNDKFDFSRNYGETIGVFASICYYQVMVPTILFCGFCYYGAKFYVDKYQICCQYSKAHIQYGRRARTTTTYILMSMFIGQIGNVVYYLILAEDTVVGCLMLVGLLVALGVLLIHTYQPQKLRKKRTAARASNKLESDASDDAEQGGEETLNYSPPKPDDLRVNIEFDDASAATDDDEEEADRERKNFSNPMIDEGDDE